MSSATHVAHCNNIGSYLIRWCGDDCERCRLSRGAVKPRRGTNETCSLAPLRESGFAYGRSEVSPDSEQIEHVIAEQFMRNSVSVEQIQDRCVRRTGEGSNSDKIAE